MRLSCVFLILTWLSFNNRDVVGYVLPNINESEVVLKIDGNNLVLQNNNDIKSWLQMVLVFAREPSNNQSTPPTEAPPCNESGAVTTKRPDVIVCKDGFIPLESKICYFFSTQPSTWHNALQDCQSKGTTLAHPMNAMENTALVNYLKANLAGKQVWWMGGSDEAKEGEWVWAHNKAPLVYTDWIPNQPDDAGKNEDCLHYWETHGWKWNDMPCTSLNHFICQQ